MTNRTSRGAIAPVFREQRSYRTGVSKRKREPGELGEKDNTIAHLQTELAVALETAAKDRELLQVRSTPETEFLNLLPVPKPVKSEKPKTRQELADIYHVSPQAVGQWESSGRLEKEGWEIIPETRNQKPILYRKIVKSST